jgi:hypothetical protein
MYCVPRPLVMHADVSDYRSKSGKTLPLCPPAGEKATVILDGLPVTGIVQSIKEDKSSFTPRWSITVAPKQSIAAQR